MFSNLALLKIAIYVKLFIYVYSEFIMTRRPVQVQRLREYFIESARSMIRGEGVRSINIRAVAENAGYSYATLYNYFKNLKDLLHCTAKEFMNEMDEFIKSRNHPAENGFERIRSLTKAYITYFVQYPGIFDLFFLEKSSDITNNDELSFQIHDYLNKLLEADWEFLKNKNEFNGNSFDNAKDIHHSIVHSLLLFFMNKKIPSDYKSLMEQYDKMFNYLM
jgi:AcrR family transcriptional regulator